MVRAKHEAKLRALATGMGAGAPQGILPGGVKSRASARMRSFRSLHDTGGFELKRPVSSWNDSSPPVGYGYRPRDTWASATRLTPSIRAPVLRSTPPF